MRQALFLSIDRKTIIDKVFQGHAVEGQGYIPPRFSTYFWQPSAEQSLAYDPAKAAQLLDDAGYKLKGDQRVGKDGKPLDLRILCHATDPNDKAIGKYLKEWWGKLGIGLKVDCLDDVSVPWYAGEYDLAFDGWSVNPDPDFVLGIHTCAALLLPRPRTAPPRTTSSATRRTTSSTRSSSPSTTPPSARTSSSRWSRGCTTPGT